MNIFSIALDGPAGAGKTSIIKAISKEFDACYISTGAMYRAVGLYMYRMGIIDDPEAIAAEVVNVPLSVRFVDDVQHTYLGDEDVTALLSDSDASMAASNVSKIAAVRTHLVQMQRDMAKNISIIMDGRDIGTVVLPDATVKIFLTASTEARARRRYQELIDKEQPEPYDVVLQKIIDRDLQDSTRDVTPMRPADDAVIVDTTELTFEESIEAVLKICREKIAQ